MEVDARLRFYHQHYAPLVKSYNKKKRHEFYAKFEEMKMKAREIKRKYNKPPFKSPDEIPIPANVTNWKAYQTIYYYHSICHLSLAKTGEKLGITRERARQLANRWNLRFTDARGKFCPLYGYDYWCYQPEPWIEIIELIGGTKSPARLAHVVEMNPDVVRNFLKFHDLDPSADTDPNGFGSMPRGGRARFHYIIANNEPKYGYRHTEVMCEDVLHTDKIPDNWCVHHINLDPFDNAPHNLIVLPIKTHSLLHLMLTKGRITKEQFISLCRKHRAKMIKAAKSGNPPIDQIHSLFAKDVQCKA